jgi:hypothetical protein
LNARSLKNKSSTFIDYVCNIKPELVAVTETALLYKEAIPVQKVYAAILNSFEYSEWNIRSVGSMPFKLIIIYRPPYSRSRPISMGTFFNELSDYLESVILCPYSILITGDFNVHADDPSNDDALRFLDLLESLGLEQHVDESTHTHGHILDLVITRIGDDILNESPKSDFCISDHISIICNISLLKPPLVEKTIQLI